MNRWSIGVLGIGLMVVLSALPVWADMEWYQHYKLGIDRLNEGNAEEAIVQLQQAIEKGPAPGPKRRTYGMFFREFFPYFYLARAYLMLHQCEEARRYLTLSYQKDGIPSGHRMYEQRQQLRQEIVQACATQPAPAEGETPEPQPPAEPEHTAPPPPAQPEQPESPPSASAPPKPAPEPPPPPLVPRAFLVQAIQYYATGKYRQAFQLLADLEGRYRLDDTAYFLMGCSLAAEFYAGRERDPALIQRARAYFRKVRRLPDWFTEPMLRNLVSPKILAIYQRTR